MEGTRVAPEWLLDINGERAREWAAELGAATSNRYLTPECRHLSSQLEELLGSPDRIPPVAARHGMLYNFWIDAHHPRGTWRRTTWDSYILDAPVRAGRNPRQTQWETLLDVDALTRDEQRELAWGGAQVLTTGPAAGTRALVTLSEGGADNTFTREMDLVSGHFLPANAGGFHRPPSKGNMSWGDDAGESVLLAGDFGAGSLSVAGYPLQVRRLRRGQAHEDAEVLVTAGQNAIAAFAARDPWGRTWLTTLPAAGRTRIWLLPDDAPAPSARDIATAQLSDGLEHVPAGAHRLQVPESAAVGVGHGWVTIELSRPWRVNGHHYYPGTLLASPLEDCLNGVLEPMVLFEPGATTSLENATWTRNHLVLTVMDDVVNRFEICTPPRQTGAAWEHHRVDLTGAADLPGRPATGSTQLRPGRALLSVTATALDPRDTDYLWVSASGWTTPSTLTVCRLTPEGDLRGMSVVRQAPARYDAKGVVVTQHLATSTDGTLVPYFQIGRPTQASAPTWVEVYGAFGKALIPGYEPVTGKAWLEGGGTLVVAGTRGGGEYGPSWHQEAIGPGRRRVREDLEAVLSSVIERGVTTPQQICVHGSSAGALAAGSLLTHRPDLLGAAVLESPLLDLHRYSQLLAGASWTHEFGDPDDPEQWEWMRQESPLHTLRAGVRYPPVLLLASKNDDRVHPWHARAVAHRLQELGQQVAYLESDEGGHAGAVTHAQRGRRSALAFTFAWRHASG